MSTTLFLFQSTHDVIKAERICLDHHVAVQVIPVPREISSECGMALEIAAERADRVRSLLDKNAIVTRTAPGAAPAARKGRNHGV